MASERLVVVDVETANEMRGSICQIGIVVYENGNEIDAWETLIDPQDEFDWMNVSIHGITEEDVQGAPVIDDVLPILKNYFDGNMVATYGSFDRLAFDSALPDAFSGVQWLDVTRIVRRTWKDFAYSGYNLANMCRHLGIDLNHHQALSDARAAGEIVFRAVAESGIALQEWPVRVNRAIFYQENKEKLKKLFKDANPDGALYGEVLVVTGTLSVPRMEFFKFANQHGCEIGNTVSKKTTMLVCGRQDPDKIKGELSRKERKTKELLESGHEIQILSEDDFRKLVIVSEN